MLTILIYDAPQAIPFFKRLHHRLFWPPVVAEEKVVDGLVLRYIFCNPYRRIHWRKVTEACGEIEQMLIPEGIRIPPRTGLSPFPHAQIRSEEAGQAALTILTQAAPDPKRCKILLYDRKGDFADLVRPLSALCNEMSIITDCEEDYEELEESLLADTGKPIRINREMPDSRYGILVAPGGFDQVVRTHPGTVVFTCGTQNLPLNGVVYHQYLPAIPEEWRTLCPDCISWERFSAAMLESGRQEGLFHFPIHGYRQRICTDTPERAVAQIHTACGG